VVIDFGFVAKVKLEEVGLCLCIGLPSGIVKLCH